MERFLKWFLKWKIFPGWLKDVKILQTCRLVSRNENSSACSSMLKYESETEEFSDGEELPDLDLPDRGQNCKYVQVRQNKNSLACSSTRKYKSKTEESLNEEESTDANLSRESSDEEELPDLNLPDLDRICEIALINLIKNSLAGSSTRKYEIKTEEISDEEELPDIDLPDHDRSCEIVQVDQKVKINETNLKVDIIELDKKVKIAKSVRQAKRKIPTLVLEIFLEWLKDVELLKTCRLVNQYWNSLACSSLRKYSTVNLNESSLERFRNCKKSRAKIRNGGALPRPFNFFHVSTSGNINDELYNLALRNKNRVTSLKLYDIPGETQQLEKLNTFLKEGMKDLSTLHLLADINNENLGVPFSDVKFPGLTNLKIQLSCLGESACNHIDSLVESLENSKLQQLTLDVRVSPHSLCLASLLKLNLSYVVELHLDLVEEETNIHFWNLLPKLKLPLLKSFKIKNDRIGNEEMQPLFRAFLTNVAVSLVSLHINYVTVQPEWKIGFEKINFSNLKVLDVTCPDNVFVCFTAENFPSLQTIRLIVTKVEQMKFLSDVYDTLESVRELHIVIDTLEREGVDLTFPPWMADLTRKFPNFVDFAVIDRKKQLPVSSWLVDILQVYPDLRSLHVEANIDFGAFCDYDAHASYRNPLNRRPSLCIFKKLEKLVWIGDDISDHTFWFCFANLTTLKYLEFSWSCLLSTETVIDRLEFLRELTRMKINFQQRNWETENAAEQLQEAYGDSEDFKIVYDWGVV